MRKIKMVITSFLGVIAVVMAFALGARVNAAATTAVETPTATGDIASKNTYIYGDADSDFSILNGNATCKAVSIAATIGNTTYNYGVTCNTGSQGFTFATKKAITADIYFSVTTSSKLAGDEWSFAGQSDSGKNGYHITVNFAANASETLSVASKRICLYLVTFEEAQTTTVTFMDGSTQLSAPSLAVGSTITYEPEKDGYQFVGWFDSENNQVTTVPNSAITLYAKWFNLSAYYTVSFNSKGGSDVDSVNAYYDENNVATLSSNMPTNPTNDGYMFAGWYTRDGSSDGNWGTRILASSKITEAMTSEKAITLYAKWIQNSSTSCIFDTLTTEYEALPASGEAGYDEDDDIVFNSYVSFGNKASTNAQSVTSYEYSKPDAKKNNQNFSDGTGYKKLVQAQVVKLHLTSTALTTIYATQTSGSNERYVMIYDENEELVESYQPSKSSTYDIYELVLGAGDFKLISYSSDKSKVEGFINYFGFKFEEFSTTPEVVFNCQYDTLDPQDATKIRFIATMDGIVDPLLIDSVVFSVTVGEVTKEFKCTQLYSSLSNKHTELGGGDFRIYATYALREIESVIAAGNVSFAALSVTVNFTASSGLDPVTAYHDPFTVGSYELEV